MTVYDQIPSMDSTYHFPPEIITALGDAFGPAWALQRNVPANQDLNVFTVPGNHRITTPDTATITNLPAGMYQAGMLENLQSGSGLTSSWWFQRITQYGDTPRLWWRSSRNTSGGWNDWQEIQQATGKITELHVFLAVGQSNMSGRGLPISGSTDPNNPRIFQYGATRKQLELATTPLDMHDTASGLSPATVAARTYLKYQPAHVGVLLIPAAHGSTGFTSATTTYTWTPNVATDPNYNLPALAVAQTNAAIIAANTAGYAVSLQGILWHQGESNSTQSQAVYAANLDSLITYFRTQFSNTKLPFLVGQMTPEGIASTSGRPNIDAAHQDTPNRVAYTGFAAAMVNGYNTGDTTHMSRRGVEFLGRNYAAALLSTQASADLKPRMLSAETSIASIPSQVSSAVTDYISNDPSVVTSAAAMAASNAGLLPKWAPNTAYLAGEQVAAPTGDILTRTANGTTGATFSITGWTPSANADKLSTLDTVPTLVVPAPSGGDDTLMLKNFFIAANSAGNAKVVFRCLEYQVSDVVDTFGCWIDGNGATINGTSMPNATALDQRYAFRASGSMAAGVTLTTARMAGDKVVTGIADTSGLAIDDVVLISNTEVPVLGLSRANRYKGELGVIESIVPNTSVTLSSGLKFSYGTTGLKLAKITPVKNVLIKDLNFKLKGVGSAHNGIQVKYGQNISLRRITTDGAEDVGITFSTVLGGRITDCFASKSTSSATLGSTGYGVAIVDGSRDIVVSKSEFFNNRHHIAGGGIWPAIHVMISNNQGRDSISASWDCHESTFWWTFDNNTADTGSHGMYIRGQYITASNNKFFNMSAEMIGVKMWDDVQEQRGIRLLFNEGTNCGWGIAGGMATGTGAYDFRSYNAEVIGNKFYNCGADPIHYRNFDGLKVMQNSIPNSTGRGIFLEGVSAGVPSNNLILGSNDVTNTTTSAIQVQYVDDVLSTGDMAINGSLYGMYFLTCNRISLGTAKVRGCAQYGIFIDGGSGHVLNTPHVSGGTGATYDALRVANVGSITVNGGYLASLRYAVFTTTTNMVTITGTNVRDTGHATKINCDAAIACIDVNMGATTAPTITAAATITPSIYAIQPITGSTTITSISVNGSTPGRRITLVFLDASPGQITDGGNLKMVGNYTPGQFSTLSFITDGTNWYETSRATT